MSDVLTKNGQRRSYNGRIDVISVLIGLFGMFGFILFLRFRVLIYYCAMQMDNIQPSMSLNTSSGLEMKQVRGTYYDQKRGG